VGMKVRPVASVTREQPLLEGRLVLGLGRGRSRTLQQVAFQAKPSIHQLERLASFSPGVASRATWISCSTNGSTVWVV
jgi:hypothetical protein